MAAADCDVLVVGGGAAGLSAALAASEDPACRVMLAESEDEVGGASAWSTGVVMAAGTSFQAREGVQDDPADLMRDYLSLNAWQVQPAIAERIAHDSGPTIEWLTGLGAKCMGLIYAGDERVPRGHLFDGLGRHIVDVLYGEVRRRPNVDVVRRARIERLLTDGAGRVVGAATADEEVGAAAVVLATGGFGANPELIEKHFPRAAAAGDWLWYIGPPSSRGDGLRLAEAVGADITGHDRGVLRLRPHFSHENEGAYLPGWMVVLNGEGIRFMDEMSPYNVAEALASAQPGPLWAVFDEETKQAAQPGTTKLHRKVNFPQGHPWEDWVEPLIDEMVAAGKIHRCDSVESLAAAIGVDVAVLGATLRTYNEDCAAGRDRFFRKEAPTFRPVATPPFYASELRLWHMPLTAAGPRIDADTHVLDAHWRPIPGLYAAGEVAGGVIGTHYVGSGNSYAIALVFGRVAGRIAAAERPPTAP